MTKKLRDDLPFSTDINAFDTSEPNHASIFNNRGDQLNSNDANLKGELDTLKQKIQAGLPANGGDSDTVDGCHAGVEAGNVLKLNERGKIAGSALTESVKTLWMPSATYMIGDTVQPIAFARHVIFLCTKAGTTNGTQPVWPTTDGEMVTDGTVTWQTVNLRNAATINGHTAGTEASNVLILDASGRVPSKVLSFMSSNSKILETFLTNSVKKWWMPSSSYALGQVIEPIGALQGQVYKCIQAGVSAAAEPAWPTGDYSEFTDGTVKWRTLAKESQSGSVGNIRFPAMLVKPNELKLNGAVLLRSSYPELWAFAQDTHLASEADYHNNGHWGKFSTGDGSTTFRVPNMCGAFLRVMAEGRTAIDPDGYYRSIGESQADAMRNITGQVGMVLYSNLNPPNGPFYLSSDSADGRPSSGDRRGVVSFDISRVVLTGSENRPKNLPYYAVIRYK